MACITMEKTISLQLQVSLHLFYSKLFPISPACVMKMFFHKSSCLQPTYLDLIVVASAEGGQDLSVSLVQPEPSDSSVAGYVLAVGMP